MATKKETQLSVEDIVVVITYFCIIIAVGIYASCKAARGTIRGYFLAGRSMSFITVGASLYVSNIGCDHFVGYAGAGVRNGIAAAAWEFNAIFFLQALGFLFLPVYIACQTKTMPEYLYKRFGGQRIRTYFALLSLTMYIVTKSSIDLYIGALFIQQSLGWDLYLSIFSLLAVVAVLTVTGGLTAVMYTDTVQACLVVFGACLLAIMSFIKIGGFDELWRRYPLAVTNITIPNTTCHQVDPEWDTMLRGPGDPFMPWPGFVFGQSLGAVWYWCSDQVIVQRVLAAKSVSHAQGGVIITAFIKILPLFTMVMPGMIARVLYTDEVACVDPDVCMEVCQSRAGCSNIAYPKLVLGVMPQGLRGLMMAVIVAALMSDLDSTFNSASSIFTIDIWKRCRRNATVREMMIVGRLFIVALASVAVAWIPIVMEAQGGVLVVYAQTIISHLGPPVAVIFLLGVLWTRCNEKGAFWGLICGTLTAVTRLALTYIFPGPKQCGEKDTRPSILKLQYMYFPIIVTAVTVLVCICASLVSRKPLDQHLYRTTFWTRFQRHDLLDTSLKPADNKDSSPATTKVSLSGVDRLEKQADSQGIVLQLKEQDNMITSTIENEEISCDAQPSVSKRSLKGIMLNWFCGQSGQLEEADPMDDTILESVEQEPKIKVFLHAMMVVVLAVGVFLYVFWSVWKYLP